MDTPDPGGSIDKPRRAEALQPDKPGQGNDVEKDDAKADEKRLEKQQGQTDQALKNVSQGYD